LSWGLRACSATVLALCASVAYRTGGASDAKAAPPPAPKEQVARTVAPAFGPTGFEVAVRLIDALKDAQLDVPNLRGGSYALDDHWRKMRLPWTALTGNAAKMAMSFATLTSQTEDEAIIPIGSGEVWRPDARKWNMSEGSFDERDAIFAPAPARITYTLQVPLDAKLSFAVATESTIGETTFRVRVKDERGTERDVFSRIVKPSEAKKWLEANVDLTEYGGRSIELSLLTSYEPPAYRPDLAGLALFGDPLILTKTQTRAPYNVLWIVVDAMRADAVQSFRDDAEEAAKRNAPTSPLEALLPRVAGLTPSLDSIAARGVRFTHAYSAATWTRPGTVGMLGGARSPELGLDSLHWQLPDDEVNRFYVSDPPLLPLLLRQRGVQTDAFVNNYFMVGYAAVGVDLGFEHIDDYRYLTRDTLEITTHTVDWLEHHKDDRFFLFCNYNSPHEPLDPPDRLLARIPPPPLGPSDQMAARYLAEVAKDDEAIGKLLQTLDELHLRDKTLIVVTADHGETFSSAHTGISGLDHMKVRYHHSASNYEETTHVPILLSFPGKLPEGKVVSARVRNIDLAPTVLDLEGIEPSPKMTGRSMLPLVRGEPDPSERVVVTDGRGTRGIMSGSWRLVARDGAAQKTIFGDKEVTVAEELFNLADDPGERHNVAKTEPDRLADMRARLESALKNAPVVGTTAAPTDAARAPRTLAMRFSGRGEVHGVSGAITTVDAATTLTARPVGLPADVARGNGRRVDVGFATTESSVVGLDIETEPPGAPVRWELFLDDKPWPADLVFAGPFGLAAPSLRAGLVNDDARMLASSPEPVRIDPVRDLGLFVTREGAGPPEAIERGRGGATEEMTRLMREWGYTHGPAKAAGTP
jgi:arylsulfatase